jgi:hypothetical protein
LNYNKFRQYYKPDLQGLSQTSKMKWSEFNTFLETKHT